MSLKKPIVLAYFLPQFHNCEFNNKWWGNGFTEWNNVRAAKPLYQDHDQPRIPSDGEFDLLNSSELSRQFQQAKDHGIDGFSIYHYWYKGERPLGKVVDLILSDPSIDIKFSLCWANHSWTRSWRNRTGTLDVLIQQEYETTAEEMSAHINFFIKAFSDPRYIRVDGKPLFQIYAPENVSHLELFIEELNLACERRLGVSIHFSGTIKRPSQNNKTQKLYDSVTLAQPTIGLFFKKTSFEKKPNIDISGMRAVLLNMNPKLRKYIFRLQDMLPDRKQVFDYSTVQKNIIDISSFFLKNATIPVNLTAFVDFDNTPRYKRRAKIIKGYSPSLFQENLSSLLSLAKKHDVNILFINAWNEWGEGMYLQPDKTCGMQRLKAIKTVMTP